MGAMPSSVVDQLIDPDLPGWRRPPPDRAGRRTDAVVAVALFAGSLLSMVLFRTAGMYDEPASGPVTLAMLAATILPLAWRRRYPSVVVVVVAIAFAVAVTIMVPESTFLNIALFAAIYAVGAWEPRRDVATGVRAVVVVGMFAWLIVALLQASTDPEALEAFESEPGVGAFSPLVAYLLMQLLTNVLYFGAAWVFGERSWTSARDRARSEYRARQLIAQRVQAETQALTIERLRIARELHDAVAHHVSVMGVQAAAARTLLGPDPERAAEALESVEESARGAIDELHGLIGTLREQGGPETEAVTALAVERLPRLVEEARSAGLPTHFQVLGEPVPLPPVTSLNLYRIAQEALTNVRKHAGRDAQADVRLRYLTDGVELEVSDDGAGPRRRRDSTGGLGLLGMRERIAAEGGDLHVGAARTGGFVVRARVPLGADRA